MKLLFLTFLLPLFSTLTFAGENAGYDQMIAYAFEKTASEVPKEKVIFCLGPQQLDEFYFEEGKEEKRVARYAAAFSIDKFKTVNDIFKKYRPTMPDKHYQLSIYRKTTKQALVRVVGTEFKLDFFQFHLKGGDIIIIQAANPDDK